MLLTSPSPRRLFHSNVRHGGTLTTCALLAATKYFAVFLFLSLLNNWDTFHEARASLKTTLMFTILVQIAIVFAVLFLK